MSDLVKGEDGKVYIVVGDHKPLNKTLVDEAGKTVTLKGKVASRDGVNLLENATSTRSSASSAYRAGSRGR